MAEQDTNINRFTRGSDYSEWEPEDSISEEREFFRNIDFAHLIYVRVISAVEIPVMILTLFALCVLMKSYRSAPVFVIHLILSDLIQIISFVTLTFMRSHELYNAYRYSLIVGLYFLACVAVERYLLVSHPVWYRSHSLKVCCVLSVIVWFVPLIFATVDSDGLYFKNLPRSIACLIPYPMVILCFIGTCCGLSRSTSLTPLNRKLTLGSLFLVLVNYTCLILPYVIMEFIRGDNPFFYRWDLLFLKVFYLFIFLRDLKPLADCLLYFFIRPDVDGLMKCVHWCCGTDTRQDSTHTQQDEHSRDSSGTLACSVSVPNPVSHSETACSSV